MRPYRIFVTEKNAESYLRELLCSGQTRYACTKCGRHYKHKHILRRHVTFECGKEPQFKCEQCSYRSKRKYELTIHMKTKHTD